MSKKCTRSQHGFLVDCVQVALAMAMPDATPASREKSRVLKEDSLI